MAISCFLYPTNENTNVPLASDSIEYFPSPFVTVPEDVPFTFTLTPGKPDPPSSETRPEMFWDCPYINVQVPIIKIVINFLILLWFVNYC